MIGVEKRIIHFKENEHEIMKGYVSEIKSYKLVFYKVK